VVNAAATGQVQKACRFAPFGAHFWRGSDEVTSVRLSSLDRRLPRLSAKVCTVGSPNRDFTPRIIERADLLDPGVGYTAA
jgi:hypothetical protein